MLAIALKEWSIVCDLLLDGQLALLLRKGGIAESGGPGVFELQHRRFVLFPSWAHQKPQMIKSPYRPRVQVLDEPDQITFRGLGDAAKIWRVTSRQAFDGLDDLHCWTPQQIDLRFSYKPQRALYLLAVRVYRLAEAKTVENDRQYAGCRSWVPLKDSDQVNETGAIPVLDDAVFEAIVARVDQVIG